MATLRIDIDDITATFDNRLRTLDDVLNDMLSEAGKFVEDAWKDGANRFGHYRQKPWSDGDMHDNVEAEPGKRKTSSYRSVQIYPRRSITRIYGRGKSQTITNAQKAFYLNYGTVVRGKTHVLADHWVEQVRQWSDPEAIGIMERIWEKYNNQNS